MKPLAQINVIPFIDIMLVLLAVVLTTATFVAQGRIPLTLPAAQTALPPSQTETLELAVDADGHLFYDDKPIALTALSQRLQTVDSETPVVLRVDAHAAFEHFVAVIDRLQQHDLHKLSIATRPEQ
jgi:biopolymer transport protein ExbD